MVSPAPNCPNPGKKLEPKRNIFWRPGSVGAQGGNVCVLGGVGPNQLPNPSGPLGEANGSLGRGFGLEGGVWVLFFELTGEKHKLNQTDEG